MICSPPQPRRHMSCCHLHMPCDILCGQNQRQLLGKQENQGGVQSTNISGKKAFSPQARSWLSMHSFFNLMPRHQNYPHNFCRTGRASRVTRVLRNSYERKNELCLPHAHSGLSLCHNSDSPHVGAVGAQQTIWVEGGSLFRRAGKSAQKLQQQGNSPVRIHWLDGPPPGKRAGCSDLHLEQCHCLKSGSLQGMTLAFLGTHITFSRYNEPSKSMGVFCLRSVPIPPMLVLT